MLARLAFVFVLLAAPALAQEAPPKQSIEQAIGETALNLAMLYRAQVAELQKRIAELEKQIAEKATR